jgi:predicted NAD/FAD-binding protein
MKIAVIGGGISGLTAAWSLSSAHEVHVFEAGARAGGHTATVDVEYRDEHHAIDTGFIVHNDRTYPQFIALLARLGVRSTPTSMSFSVSDAFSGIEYAGTNLDSLFAQRSNLLSPRFLRMVRDILRFNREVEAHLQRDPGLAEVTLGDYLRRHGYSDAFRDLYLLPMGAAIWSSDQRAINAFPLQFFVRFFRNHGLLDLRNRPQWRVIEGGSRSYLAPLTAPFRERLYVNTPVTEVWRVPMRGGTEVRVSSARGTERFDEVILACHSDQALRILGDATPAECAVLGAIPYTRNDVVLHTDTALLPRNRACWSSWNVSLGRMPADQPTLTYNMNILQGLRSAKTWCVSLNQTRLIPPEHVYGMFRYDHPVFTQQGIRAQERWHEINGVHNTWFCGAWWRNGFHEDGVWSALRVADELQGRHERRTALALACGGVA